MEFSLDSTREVLRRSPGVLQNLLAGLSEDWVNGDEGPHTWSPYQAVGRITAIKETDWMDRTRRILEHGVKRVFEPIDREAGFSRFSGWSLDDLLSRVPSVRA